jgi:hypothetical protein
MFEIFKAEWSRFRGPMLALAGAHLALLAFLLRMVDPAQQPVTVHWAFGACYAALGVLTGMYQMGSYRRPNVWLALLHRPMAPWRIAIMLMAAALVALLCVVAVPMLLAASWQTTMTARVVDLRHWLLPLSALQIAAIGYLIGAHAILAERRYAFAGLVCLLLLPLSEAHGFGMLALEALLVLWLAGMVLATFRPDLERAPRDATGAVLVAVPLAMALFLALQMGFMALELIWIAQGSHPNNTPTPPRGGHNEIEKTDERTRMRMAFDGSRHPDAPLLREQIALSETVAIGQRVPGVPVRHELSNVMPMEFDDRARGLRWVFSHDDMRFHGYRLGDRTAVGTLGLGRAQAPFATPPLPAGGLPGLDEGDAVLIAGNRLYRYDSANGLIEPRITLPANELLLGIDAIGERIGVMSDAALYFYDGRDAVELRGEMTPRMRVPFPQRGRNLGGIDMIELVDGYLIVLATDANAHSELGSPPVQYALRVREDGTVDTLARRSLRFDFPAPYRYRWIWASPLAYGLNEAAKRAFSPWPLSRPLWPPMPAGLQALAVLLGALSAFVAWRRGRRLTLSRRARAAWVAACAVAGLPALAAYVLLYRPDARIPRTVDAPAATP